MDNYRISMPHRHTVRYEANEIALEFEVELTMDGVIFYCVAPRVISGTCSSYSEQADLVADWLRRKFSKVEIDTSPPTQDIV